ncbi:hypothetical protein L9F63_021903 [Diploptera punctata]|uniref:Uncharacterized protein n=1 Tax=Diploptera punctata TaxID=6984 RepID=A0AAD7ZNL9_DIPPU|nr:hypothetical protein L9F63_021903 [Diploptera punctata]
MDAETMKRIVEAFDASPQISTRQAAQTKVTNFLKVTFSRSSIDLQAPVFIFDNIRQLARCQATWTQLILPPPQYMTQNVSLREVHTKGRGWPCSPAEEIHKE